MMIFVKDWCYFKKKIAEDPTKFIESNKFAGGLEGCHKIKSVKCLEWY